MMSDIFKSSAIAPERTLTVIRIVFGLLLIYHGKEIFEPATMNEYTKWELFSGPSGLMKAYVGKTIEFVAGLSFLLGLFTRLGAILVIGIFTFITFFIGHGRFWYEDQHPFMFLLFGILFLFIGPGKSSLDHRIFGGSERV